MVDAGQLNHSARVSAVCIFGTNIGARRAYARIAEYEIASAWDLPADRLMIGCWEVFACVGAGGTVCVYDPGCSVLVPAPLPYFFCCLALENHSCHNKGWYVCCPKHPNKYECPQKNIPGPSKGCQMVPLQGVFSQSLRV